MLYSSGTTGPAQGRQGPPLPDAAARRGPRRSPGLAQLLFGFDREIVYLSPAPLYHAAPAALQHGRAAPRRHGRASWSTSTPSSSSPSSSATRCTPHAGRADDVHPHAQAAPEVRTTLRRLSSLQVCVHAAAPCPVEVKRADDRVVGPDHPRVLRRHRGQRVRVLQLRGLAGAPGHGRARPSPARSTSSTRTATSCPPASRARSTSRAAPSSSTTTTPRRPPASRNAAGAGRTLGDVGYLDDDGFLYLTDRKAYMIISGGVNIYPQEAENVLVDAPEGARRRRLRRAQRGLRRGGQGGRAAGRRWPTPAPTSSAS